MSQNINNRAFYMKCGKFDILRNIYNYHLYHLKSYKT